MIICSNQTFARLLCRYRVHDGIELMERIVGKEHLRHQTRKHGWAKYREMNVGRTPGVGMVLPGIRTWTNRQESVDTVFIRQTASNAKEVRIKRTRPLIPFMEVTSSGIGLPDLQKCVWHWISTVVKHATGHNDTLTDGLAAGPCIAG